MNTIPRAVVGAVALVTALALPNWGVTPSSAESRKAYPLHRAQPGGEVVADTKYFEFVSDFETNLNDALVNSGVDRNFSRPELFRSSEDSHCFDSLAPSLSEAWDVAVDYYAEVISKKEWNSRVQFLLRVDLAGLEEITEPRDLRYLEIVGHLRAAAAPAYEACRWAKQDAQNRAWVRALVPLLDAHADAIAGRLAAFYGQPLGGLPMRVDVVKTVNWAGANTIYLPPAGGHIQISSATPTGHESLEMISHEASHTIMGPRRSLDKALIAAAEELEVEPPRGLWHGVLFHTTGEAVRRVLEEAGEPDYQPMMFAQDIFERFHDVLLAEWKGYLDGEKSLGQAALDLVRAAAAQAEAN